MSLELQNKSEDFGRQGRSGLYEMPNNAEDFKPDTEAEREQKKEKAFNYLIEVVSQGKLVTKSDIEENTEISSEDLSLLIITKRNDIRSAFYKRLTELFIPIKHQEDIALYSLHAENYLKHYEDNFPLLGLAEGFQDYLNSDTFISVAILALIEDINSTNFPNLRPILLDLPDDTKSILFSNEKITQAIHKWLRTSDANDKKLAELYFNRKFGRLLLNTINLSQEEQIKIDKMLELEYENILNRFNGNLNLEDDDKEKLETTTDWTRFNKADKVLELRKKIAIKIIANAKFDFRTMDMADLVLVGDKSDIRNITVDSIKQHIDEYFLLGNENMFLQIPASGLIELGVTENDWAEIFLNSLQERLDLMLNNYNGGSAILDVLDRMRENMNTEFINGIDLPRRIVRDIIGSNHKSLSELFYNYGAKFAEKFNLSKDGVWPYYYADRVRNLGLSIEYLILNDFYINKLSSKEVILKHARDASLFSNYDVLSAHIGENQMKEILKDSDIFEALNKGFLAVIPRFYTDAVEIVGYIDKFNININDPTLYPRIRDQLRKLIAFIIDSNSEANRTIVRLLSRGTEESLLDVLHIKEEDIADLRVLAIRKLILGLNEVYIDKESEQPYDMLGIVQQGILFISEHGTNHNSLNALKDLALISKEDLEIMLKKPEVISALNKTLIQYIAEGKDIKSIQDFLVNFNSVELENIYLLFLEGEGMRKLPFNKQRQRWGLLTSLIIQNGDTETLCKQTQDPAEKSKIESSLNNIKQFSLDYPISNKGTTIAILTAMNSYKEWLTLGDILKKTDERLQGYRKVISKFEFKKIPDGFRATIGMEYEITNSTAMAYEEVSGGNPQMLGSSNSLLEAELNDISDFAYVGNGRDATFEIATKPIDNPALMLLEMELLQDLGYIDLNFNKSDYYLKGSRGYHLTIGGESQILISQHVNILQNSLLIAGWGGINAGKSIDKVFTSRNESSVRQRGSFSALNNNMVQLFQNTSSAVELRGLSIDSWEPFERSVLTSYLASIAIQIAESYKLNFAHYLIDIFNSDFPFPKSLDEFLKLIIDLEGGSFDDIDDDIKSIIMAWTKLYHGVLLDIYNHNENFIEQEISGYLDERGFWIDADVNNRKRFIDIAGSEHNLSLYLEKIRISPNKIIAQTNSDFINSCTAITNLFIKPSEESGGDMVNASAILDSTKDAKTNTIENSKNDARNRSIFDNDGEIRQGYYYVQGGSPKMLIHSVQKRLLEFNKEMQKIIS